MTTGSPTAVGHETATLTGNVDPVGGPAITECEFQYGTTKTYSSGSAPCSPEATVGSPFEDRPPSRVHWPASQRHDLSLPAGRRHLERHNGRRGPHGDSPLRPGCHRTCVWGDHKLAQLPERNGESENLSTTYYFQYGKSTAYGTDTAIPPGTDLGTTEEADQPVSTPREGLEPGTNIPLPGGGAEQQRHIVQGLMKRSPRPARRRSKGPQAPTSPKPRRPCTQRSTRMVSALPTTSNTAPARNTDPRPR